MLPAYQSQGYGRQAANLVFKQAAYPMEISVLPSNHRAVEFWCKVLNENAMRYAQMFSDRLKSIVFSIAGPEHAAFKNTVAKYQHS